MPKSFLVRKKSSVQIRNWEDVTTPVTTTPEEEDAPQRKSEVSPGVKMDGHLSADRLTECKDVKDEEKPSAPRKRLCSEESRDRNPFKHLRNDVFHFPPNIPPYPHLNPPAFSKHGVPEVFGRNCPDIYHFPRVPLMTSFHPQMLWTPLHAPAQSSPFLQLHSPPHWLPSPPPTKSPPTKTWNTATGKTTSPVGVLSPAEIPSPSSSTVAEEPSSYNCAVVPGIPAPKIEFSRFPDPSTTVVRSPCFPVRENPSQPFPKGARLKVEVINNGFGIKNPLLTTERQQPPKTSPVAPPYLLTTEAGHTCSLCGFKSDSLRVLQKHLKSHKEIKRFLCTVCAKGFNDTFDLKRHTRTHTGVRPYKCEKCGKAFTQRCSLESHSKKIHGIKFQFAFNERRTKTYVCEECGHSTSDPEDHFVHLRTQHPNNPAILRCHDRRQFKFSRRKAT